MFYCSVCVQLKEINMPSGEIETHPYLDQGEIQGSTKLILGSFPVYECTDHDNPLKQRNRLREGTTRFFYGSADSEFWEFYKNYIDSTIERPLNQRAILLSLSQRNIAISDTIISCERKEYSSADNDLKKKEYNVEGLQTLIPKGVKKILCTSKGVLIDLENQIICKRISSIGVVDNIQSQEFQSNFINALGGNVGQIVNPISKVFSINNDLVKALAIPSPGSYYRQLDKFGFNGNDRRSRRIYAYNYFSNAFTWLNSD